MVSDSVQPVKRYMSVAWGPAMPCRAMEGEGGMAASMAASTNGPPVVLSVQERWSAALYLLEEEATIRGRPASKYELIINDPESLPTAQYEEHGPVEKLVHITLRNRESRPLRYKIRTTARGLFKVQTLTDYEAHTGVLDAESRKNLILSLKPHVFSVRSISGFWWRDGPYLQGPLKIQILISEDNDGNFNNVLHTIRVHVRDAPSEDAQELPSMARFSLVLDYGHNRAL